MRPPGKKHIEVAESGSFFLASYWSVFSWIAGKKNVTNKTWCFHVGSYWHFLSYTEANKPILWWKMGITMTVMLQTGHPPLLANRWHGVTAQPLLIFPAVDNVLLSQSIKSLWETTWLSSMNAIYLHRYRSNGIAGKNITQLSSESSIQNLILICIFTP